jgi:hypothetical protein
VWYVYKRLALLHIILDILSIEGGSGSWAPNTANSWRTTTDIGDSWVSMMSNIKHVT